jgi:hypothetical protein
MTIGVDADLGLMSSLGQATQAHQRRTLELRGSWYDFSILSKTRIVDCAPITPLHPKPLFNNGLQFGLGTGTKDRRFRQRKRRCVVASDSAATYVEAAHSHNSRNSKGCGVGHSAATYVEAAHSHNSRNSKGCGVGGEEGRITLQRAHSPPGHRRRRCTAPKTSTQA